MYISIVIANDRFPLILKNKNLDSEYVIDSGDLMLVKIKKESMFPLLAPKFFGGRFVAIAEDSIFFETPNKIGPTYLSSVNINEIEAIYSGNVRTFNTLWRKWATYLSLLMIYPASTLEPGWDVLMWASFSGLFSVSYGPAIASIDFHIRLKKSREFLIGQNNWIMSY